MPRSRAPSSAAFWLPLQPRRWWCRTCSRCCGRATTARRPTAYSTRTHMDDIVSREPPHELVPGDAVGRPLVLQPATRRRHGPLFGAGVVLALTGALIAGGWRYGAQERAVAATTQ